MINAEAYSANKEWRDLEDNSTEEPLTDEQMTQLQNGGALEPILDVFDSSSTRGASAEDVGGGSQEYDPSNDIGGQQESGPQYSAEHERRSFAFEEIKAQLNQDRLTFQARYITLKEALGGLSEILQSNIIDTAERDNVLNRLAEITDACKAAVNQFKMANGDLESAMSDALDEGLISEDELAAMKAEASSNRTEIDNGEKTIDIAERAMAQQRAHISNLGKIGTDRTGKKADSQVASMFYSSSDGGSDGTGGNAGPGLEPIL